MSEAWRTLVGRVARVETVTEALGVSKASKSDAARGARIAESYIQRAGRTTVTVALRDVASSEQAIVATTHTWAASYSTGGDSVSFASLVDSLTAVIATPQNGRTFTYDSGNSKLISYDSPNVETSAATNLESEIGTSPVLVIGTDSTLTHALPAYVATGDELLKTVRLSIEADIDADTTNYWTIQARVRRVGQALGEELGTELVTSTLGIESLVARELYSNATGLALSEGDMVLLRCVAATTSSATIERPTLTLDIQRRVT